MTTIPLSLTYTDFLDKVGKIRQSSYRDPPIMYHDLYTLIKERLGGKSIKSFEEFKDKCGDLGTLIYQDLYFKLYPDNDNSKASTRNKKGGRKRRCQTRRHKIFTTLSIR
jgi:hypothetical protein